MGCLAIWNDEKFGLTEGMLEFKKLFFCIICPFKNHIPKKYCEFSTKHFLYSLLIWYKEYLHWLYVCNIFIVDKKGIRMNRRKWPTYTQKRDLNGKIMFSYNIVANYAMFTIIAIDMVEQVQWPTRSLDFLSNRKRVIYVTPVDSVNPPFPRLIIAAYKEYLLSLKLFANYSNLLRNFGHLL